MDDDHDDDEEALTTAQADEVMALVQTALSDRVAPTPPIEGDVAPLIENTLDHSLGDHVLWLTDALIGVSLCPGCGGVALYLLTPTADFLHGAVEMVESLRRGNDDLNDVICTYRRAKAIAVIENEDIHATYVYVFAASYWLRFDGVEDRVIHTTRALVSLLDAVLSILTAAAVRAADMSKEPQDGKDS